MSDEHELDREAGKFADLFKRRNRDEPEEVGGPLDTYRTVTDMVARGNKLMSIVEDIAAYAAKRIQQG